jgi:hypothetical protein
MRCSGKSFRSWIVAIAPVVTCAGLAAAQLSPVAATGWNRDIVVEATASPPYNTVAMSFDVPNNYAFYESALPGSSKGLPLFGGFTSVLDSTPGQFQPYTGNNALFMNATAPSGTLTLLPAAQRPYNRLAIFAVSANGGGTGTLVLNFSDGSSSSAISYNAQDWFFVTANNALNNLGRVTLTGAIDDGSAGNPRIYQTNIDLTPAGLNLNGQSVVSITFNKPATANTSVVVAISGEVNAALSGACCASDGSCTVTSPGGCSGAFHSEWATCAVAQCPQPTACCFADGSCTLAQSGDCTAAGGASQAGSCGPNPCPQPGACCDPASACSIAQESACVAANGLFLGQSTTCTPNNCPPRAWACCFADGSCLALTQADCSSLGGGGTWNLGLACTQAFCAGENLLVNPGAETGDLTGWTLELNGGNGWSANFDDIVHSGMNAFSTSYGLGVKSQEVDLVAAGFSEALLDSAPPIAFSEWVASRFDQGARYFVKFDVLDVNRAVIATFSDGAQDALVTLGPGTAYFRVSNTFTGYGPGARFLKITSGGQDVAFWAGNYGAHFDDAFAGIVQSRACCLPGGICQTADIAGCIGAGGTSQPPGSTCSPSPCGTPVAGACCRGSNCAADTSAACTGPNTRFAGAGTACNAPGNYTTPCCKADHNQSGAVTVQDIFDFLSAYFTTNPSADANGSGAVTVQDIFDFLSAYFTGCV